MKTQIVIKEAFRCSIELYRDFHFIECAREIRAKQQDQTISKHYMILRKNQYGTNLPYCKLIVSRVKCISATNETIGPQLLRNTPVYHSPTLANEEQEVLDRLYR